MDRDFVCKVEEVPANGMRECVSKSGCRLLVANSGSEFFAYQAICPHQDVPLCEGLYDGNLLTCHMHLWQWDIRTGSPVGLAEAPLERFELTVEGDSIYVGSKGAIDVGELFAGASEATIARMSALARREAYEPGKVIYAIGDPAEDFFVLESGRVEFRIGREGRTSPAGFMLRKGETFGWAALLDDHPARIASATALEASSVLRINGREAVAALEGDAASGVKVMRRLAALIARYLAEPGSK